MITVFILSQNLIKLKELDHSRLIPFPRFIEGPSCEAMSEIIFIMRESSRSGVGV